MASVLESGALKKTSDGKTKQPQHYIVSVLNEGHMDLIMALQATIIQNLSRPGLMEPISFIFMKEHIERQGFILGVFVDQRLIAYRIVYFPHSQDKTFNMGFDICLAEDQRSMVANLQMVCVHPRFRGNGLAKKLNHLALRLLKEQHDCEHVFATVSPYNVWNIRILLNSGFRIAMIKLKYGGKLRYIVYQKLRTPMDFTDGEVVYTRLDDLDTQKEIFTSGFYGVALAHQQHIDTRFKKNLTLYNYIIFKRPFGQQAVHVGKRDQQAVNNTTKTAFSIWCPDLKADRQWRIAGDSTVTAGREYPLGHIIHQGISTTL